MKTTARGLARDRGGDIDEVAIAIGARTEHGVGEDDGIGLCPGDVATDLRAGVHLVRRTGPGLAAAEVDVGLHEIAPTLGDPALALGVLQDQVRVNEVDGADVDGRGHAHLTPEGHELLGEVQARLAVEDAPVNVDRVDIDKFGGTADAAQLGDDPHGEGNGRALLPLQHCLLMLGEREGHPCRLPKSSRAPRPDAPDRGGFAGLPGLHATGLSARERPRRRKGSAIR